MSLYNMIMGVNTTLVLFVMPMLGRSHREYPRFRDVFIGDKGTPGTEGKIIIYTRSGGGNREDYEKEHAELRASPHYAFDFDNDFDNIYANWVFNVPDQFKADFALIFGMKPERTSEAYKKAVLDAAPENLKLKLESILTVGFEEAMKQEEVK